MLKKENNNFVLCTGFISSKLNDQLNKIAVNCLQFEKGRY